MAYKKYIRKNGKLYGPYIYHSKRIDGKVVSEYYGTETATKGKKYKKILLLFAGVLLLGILIYFLAFSNNKIAGKVVLGVDASYEKGEPLDGVLKFSITEGELIPDSSKIVFENSGKSYEFALNEVFNEKILEGDYYVSGKKISGSGAGYGIEGEKITYPEIEFVLQVYTESKEETTESTSELDTEENEPSSITENQVKSSKGVFASFFGIAGMVSMELEKEIDGSTSKDDPFTYNLKEGERAELKHNSVRLNGEELDDKFVSLETEDDKIIVSTDYSEKEKGYGADYEGDKKKTISVDLSKLNLLLEEGDLDIKLVYQDKEIVSLTTILKEGEKNSKEAVIDDEPEEVPVKEEPKENVNIKPEKENKTFEKENKTVEEVVDTSLWNIGDFLTQAEREILMNEFGEITLESTKSELYKGRIIRGYRFGEYSIEYSYDSSLNRELLGVQMDRDRIKFLKDIANSISKEEAIPKKLEGYNQTYTP